MSSTKGLVSLLAATCMMVPFTAGAAPAVPSPGESLEKPQVTDNKVVVENDNTTPAAVPTGTKFKLQSIKVNHDGMKLKEARLQAITQKIVGREITAQELNAAVAEITAYARKAGYPAAIAYIPEQTAKKGNLQLNIEPGRFDKITIVNDGVLQERLPKGYLAGLKTGDIVRTKKLEKALRNLRDLPGINVRASLSPGAEQGTSNLTVKVDKGDVDAYVLYAENYGSRASGRYRYGLQADWRNLEGSGARINAGGLISNSHQRGYNIGLETPVGHSATVMGVGFSHSNYELGSIWSQLGVKGKSNTISLYGRTPLQNTATNGLNLVYAYNYRQLTDEFNHVDFGDRHSHSVSLGLDGRARTAQSALQYNVTLHNGNLVPGSQVAAVLADAGAYKGHFFKGTFDTTALQKLGGPFDVMLKLSGQKAASNLDSSEHIYLGGAKGIRAYPQGEASGDEGILGNLELRYHTPVKGLTLSTYFDAGRVKAEKSGSNATTLKGWGLGLTYAQPNDWFARIDYARRIGFADNLSRDAESRGRIWFMVGKIF
ncbi:ShlB/FhaC/HecB family hemolysin secretion/activation protein [Selenomonas ruminantium]|uniref:ShlB/FhaC/HecB family hemolysin secretion/activation protein n=1 Tax=Selenomonas ruminantium TaxID=971 RepID=UPI0015BB777C|nr:ShlB/FhaC/HecB family hemolysin secretion/activation protein [Selenomonas ruminantium]